MTFNKLLRTSLHYTTEKTTKIVMKIARNISGKNVAAYVLQHNLIIVTSRYLLAIAWEYRKHVQTLLRF